MNVTECGSEGGRGRKSIYRGESAKTVSGRAIVVMEGCPRRQAHKRTTLMFSHKFPFLVDKTHPVLQFQENKITFECLLLQLPLI